MLRTPFVLTLLTIALAGCSHRSVQPDGSASTCGAIGGLTKRPLFSLQWIDSGLPLRGQWRDGFQLADLNGDGHVDLIHGPARKGNFQPNLFLGDGTGRFKLDMSAHWPPLPFDYGDVAVADFNRDNVLDVALSAHLRGVAVLINEGRNSFAPWSDGLVMTPPSAHPEQPIFGSRAIAAIDWNRDGLVDLLATNEGPALGAIDRSTREMLRLYLNRGGFFEQRDVKNTVSGWANALAVGDVTGDRWPEAITGTEAFGNRRLLHIGFGTDLNSQELRSLPEQLAVHAVERVQFDAESVPSMLFAGQIDQVASGCATLVRTDFQAGLGDRSQTLWSEPGRDDMVAVRAADIGGDARLELLAVHRSGRIRVLVEHPNRRGNATWRTAMVAEPPEPLRDCQAWQMQLANIDGDPASEIVVSYASDGDVTGLGRCPNSGGLAAFNVVAP
ncbi:FG-GAP repeat domain-containing protein [Ahniella affigens]|nr:VCBS repeat-containing protein [Ahniella affigens]